MHDYNESDGFHEHKHDGLLVFVCFLGSSLVGYFLMHGLVALGI